MLTNVICHVSFYSLARSHKKVGEVERLLSNFLGQVLNSVTQMMPVSAGQKLVNRVKILWFVRQLSSSLQLAIRDTHKLHPFPASM